MLDEKATQMVAAIAYGGGFHPMTLPQPAGRPAGARVLA
jgi:hypothetical protein